MKSTKSARDGIERPNDKKVHGSMKGQKNQGKHFEHGGMHHRRDKRYPFASKPRPEDIAEAEAFDAREEPGELDIPQWKEALMLWLSWNSTYEKLTARMCKTGQDQQKLETLMDEMDRLRKSAINVSERLLK